MLDDIRNWWKLKNYEGYIGYVFYIIFKEYEVNGMGDFDKCLNMVKKLMIFFLVRFYI